MTTTETPDVQDFNRLVEIVAEHFRVTPSDILATKRSGPTKTPRHVIAAIYSNWATLQRTADLMGLKSHQNVYYSRRRVQELIDEGRYASQFLAIMDQVEQDLPLMLP